MKPEYIVVEKSKYGNIFVKGSFETLNEAIKLKKGLLIVNEVSKNENALIIFCNVNEKDIDYNG